MIEATALRLPPPRRNLWLVAIGAALVAAAAGAAVAIPLALRNGGESTPPGFINYITRAGEFTVSADGEPAKPVVAPPMQLIPPAQNAEYISPDGTVAAVIELPADGSSWLALRQGVETSRVGLLTEPDAPLLFNGDKTAAQNAGGIPLVVSWSPDSRYLAYGSVSDAPFSMHVLDRSTGATQDFLVPDGYVGELAWAPDGSHLAMSSYTIDRKHHTVYLWDPGNGSFTELIDGCHIVWSPDSRNLVLHRDPYAERGVWVVPIDGSERYPLSDDPSGFPMAWVAEER